MRIPPPGLGIAQLTPVTYRSQDRFQWDRLIAMATRTINKVTWRKSPIVVMTIVSALSAAGCGSGNGPSVQGGGVLIPIFDSIQLNVLTPLCTNCHVGATAPLGLRLDAANSYALLVGRASVQDPALLRVDPGNPNASYLIRKLEGTAATGGQMPLGAPTLAQADIDIIRQWITTGALRTPATVTGPIRVTSLDPLPNSAVPMLPMSVTAIFDRELNATTVDATTFFVERAGGDGSFGDGNEVTISPVSVTVPSVNSRTALFDMSTTTPVEDTYQVTLAGTGAAVLLDLGGNALDGEFTGSFPSGDDAAGGDFVAEFSVVGVQPTLQSIQDNVFTPVCAGCHTGPTSNDVNDLPGGMDLTSLSMSFMSLVGVTSLEDNNFQRVNDGDADASYLIQKLEGTASSGSQMPDGGAPLDQATIDVIRQWITDGAMM